MIQARSKHGYSAHEEPPRAAPIMPRDVSFSDSGCNFFQTGEVFFVKTITRSQELELLQQPGVQPP